MVPLIAELREKGTAPDDSWLKGKFSVEQQVGLRVQGTVHHPAAAGIRGCGVWQGPAPTHTHGVSVGGGVCGPIVHSWQLHPMHLISVMLCAVLPHPDDPVLSCHRPSCVRRWPWPWALTQTRDAWTSACTPSQVRAAAGSTCCITCIRRHENSNTCRCSLPTSLHLDTHTPRHPPTACWAQHHPLSTH